MRMRGVIPAAVFVETDLGLWHLAGEWPRWMPRHAYLFIEAKDSLPLLDLRCLVGLPVFVQGEDETRVNGVAAACAKAGAKRVIGTTYQPASDYFRMTDTRQ
jgi:hypothetical protein